MEFENIRKLRSDIIRNFKSSFSESSLQNNTSLQLILDGLIASNKFVIIINFNSDKVVFEYNLKNITGYELEEFTVPAMNNAENAPIKLIHDDDLVHKIRYDKAVYKLINKNLKLAVLDDFYETTFRISHKDGTILKMRRKCYFFNLNENGNPKTHLDVWEHLENDNSTFVKSRVQSKYYKAVNKDFQNYCDEELGLKLTKRQKEILFYKNQALNTRKIAEKLFISEKTVNNHLDQIKAKVNSYCKENNIDFKAKSTFETLHFLKLYGVCDSF